jgi:glycosyltransferase involved in cell wall biosynthesis
VPPWTTPPRPPARAAPVVSVVICTRDRASYLRRAIASVVEQRPADHDSEIIVVDNQSSDGTPAVVGEFASHGVRYLLEPRVGLCHARNAGWRSARGRYVAYLDDDAIACPGWLAAVREAFERTPGAGVVGGRVEPIWEGPRPRWLSDDVALTLTILDWSDAPKEIADVRVEWLVGANMAATAAALAEVGGFHPWLDRAGSNMLSSGDVFLEKQIIRRGYRCVYYPAMAVRHAVPAARLTKRWFRRRYFWQGVSDAVMQLVEEAPGPSRRLRLALARAGRLLASPRALAVLLLPTDDPRRFTEKCFTWIAVGHVAGLLGAARR